MERSYFHQVQDVFEGFVLDVAGVLHVTAHQRGIKVWYDDAIRDMSVLLGWWGEGVFRGRC